MESSEYQRLYELEEQFWWFQGMQHITRELLNKYSDSSIEQKLLDAGCGTGGMFSLLSQFGHATGIDSSTKALELAARRKNSILVQADVSHLPFTENSFDIVTSLDVLYHLNVKNDVEVLKELARVIRPGGIMLLRVPAFNQLRSTHDEVVHTRQRYGKSELITKLEQANLDILFVSYANCLLFPIAVAYRHFFQPKTHGSDLHALNPYLNMALTLLLKLEAYLLKHFRLPFGLSLVAIIKKRKPSEINTSIKNIAVELK